MARKKRRKSPPPPPSADRKERFHAPFHDLKKAWQQTHSSSPPAPSAPPPSQSNEALHAETKRRQAQAQQERDLFLEAMSDVTPLPPDPRGRVDRHRQPSSKADIFSDEEAGVAELQDVVAGRSTFIIEYTDEYIEGVAPGVDRYLAQRLHRGDFAIQGHLDLHGYTVEEAKVLVGRFLTNAYKSGQRCVRLIHGRGRNSPDNRPVLKEYVHTWLSQGRLSRLVLAFASAPAHDGGAGAAYVLLRRMTRTRPKSAEPL